MQERSGWRAFDPLRFGLLLIAASPIAFAIAAILLGKEAGWDLQNYHWYNPYAFLHGRLGFDVAVAHHATYYNPLSDIPFFWLATHGPAWLAAAYMGALFGIAVALTGVIAWQVIGIANHGWRVTVAALIAIAGAVGGGALPALGSTANDVPVALGIFAALGILVTHFTRLRDEISSRALVFTLLLAGVCAGISVGIKLTTAIYALGLLAAMLLTASTWRQYLRNVLLLGSGMLLGFLISGGPWLWRMWEYGSNPFFPYFNQLFHSPLLIDASYRDPTYTDGHTWLGRLLFPWRFTLNSFLVAEWKFRDARILAAYVLIPLTLLIRLFAARHKQFGPLPPLYKFLFCFAAITYAMWQVMFSVYRYLIPMEMLAPLLIVMAISLWPIAAGLRLACMVGVMLVLQSLVIYNPPRQAWDDQYVRVQVPALPDAQHSMVLMVGTEPMAFVIPSFPAAIPFLRIDGWMVWKDDRSSGLARQMRDRVAQHDGPLFMLFAATNQQRASAAAQAYGLRLSTSCSAIRSNIAEPLQLCRLLRTVLR